MRILIIDDQSPNANHLKMALEMWGFEVQVATTGELGVRIAGQFHPSLVLCHLALPDMDGYAVARTLRRHSALIQTRFVAVTASDSEPDSSALKAAGFETSLSDDQLYHMTAALRQERKAADDDLAPPFDSQDHNQGFAFPVQAPHQDDRTTQAIGSPGTVGGDAKLTNPKRKGASILVVEPHATSRATLQWILEREGYQVLVSENGLTALKLFIRAAPQIVLQNLLLPDIDGCGLAHWLRLLPGGNTVPLLAMSNKPTLLNQARSSTARLDRFLSRPCLPSYILQTIHGILPARGSDADYPPHLWKTRTPSNIISTISFEGHRWPGARILVVESNNFQCHELISHLVEWGFDVSLVRDGEEALYHAQVRRPDIVIIDPIVPGLDGFEFCYEMKKNQLLASTAVILSPAGAVTEVDAALAQEMGAVGYASRAPDFRELDALLQTTFAKSQAALRSQKLP